MDENHRFLCIYHVLDRTTGRVVSSEERFLTRAALVNERIFAVQKEEIATQARHGGPAVSVVLQALVNID